MQPATSSQTLSSIYRDHYAFVWAVLRRFGVELRDIEDVSQDVFIVVHRRLDDFEGRSSVRTWLYAICFRVAMAHLRRRRQTSEADEPVAAQLIADANQEEVVARGQAEVLLHKLLGKLDDDKRAVFVLADIEGLPAPVIAEIVGAKTRTVYSRLRAARERFSAELRRVHAREDGVFQARALVHRGSRRDAPPNGTAGRVWGLLALRLAEPAVASATTFGFVKAAALSLGIGVAALGVVFVATAPLRAAEPDPKPVKAAIVERSQSAADVEVPPKRPVPSHAEPEADLDPLVPEPPARVAAHNRPAPFRADKTVDRLSEEVALMAGARDALHAGDNDRALAVLDKHAARFPDGKFAPERRRSRATALCRLDRVQEAQVEAKTLGLPAATICAK